MKRVLVWFAWLVGIVSVVALAVVFASRFGTDPTLAPSPLLGKPAPGVTLRLVDDGSTVTMADFTGDVVVVNFWAPWCVPCRAEHAVLVAAAETYGASGVSVLGIVYDSNEDHVNTFLDELGRAYPAAMDDGARAAISFGVRGVPETFFVDRAGTVVAKVTGPVDWPIVASTLDAILAGEVLVPGQP